MIDEEDMKVNLTKVEEVVKKIVRNKLVKEGVLTDDLLPGSNNKLAAYLEKSEKFIDKTIEEASELADEGQELMRTNFTLDVSVGERNRILLVMIGFLRKIRNGLAASMIDIRKTLG
jgi:hypothetical protein